MPVKTKSAVTPNTTPGRFGAYGGCYAPETLMAALEELDLAYAATRKDRGFRAG